MAGLFSRWILMQWLLFVAVFGAAFTASAAPLILQGQPCSDLSGYMEILSDPTNKLTVDQIASRKDWKATVRGRVPNLDFTSNAIWVRFSLTNRDDQPQKYFISVEYPVINAVTFYTTDARGSMTEERTGLSTPATANILPDRHFLFPVSMGQGETKTVYLKILSPSRITLPVHVMTAQALLRKAIRDYTIYGALFGLLVLVILYFVSVGPFLYKGTPVWLALYSIFFGLHAAIRGGFVRPLLPDDLLGITGILQLVIVTGLFFTGAKFFRLFLSLKSHSLVLDRIMMFFQYLSLTFVVILLFPTPIIIIVTLILIVINPIFSICLAIYFWRKGVSNAGWFAVGWITPHFVAVYDFFRIHGVVSYEPLGEWPIPFSLFIALFFLSIAMIRQNSVDHRMAQTDPLTGLANRRKLNESLQEEWDRCRRLGSPLSMIMADVDHFKEYNDTFGHRAGDQCLCAMADILSSHARRTGDLAVRYGGEEFVLLLPHLDAADAFSVAEKIRNTVSAMEPCGADRNTGNKITVSLGVATTIPEGRKNPEDLIQEADKALYEAKHQGRNRTVADGAFGI